MTIARFWKIGLPTVAGSLLSSHVALAQQQPIVVTTTDPQQTQTQGQPIVVTQQGQVVTQGGATPTIIVVQQGPAQPAPAKPRTIPAVDGQEPPLGYHREQTMLKGLAIAGWSLFGAGYALTALGGAVSSAADAFGGGDGSYGLVGLIPLVGPWIFVANDDLGGSRALFALLGVMQVGGMAMGIAGVAAKTEIWVSDSAKNTDGPRFTIGPTGLGFKTSF
jgi:hypothetical protein